MKEKKFFLKERKNDIEVELRATMQDTTSCTSYFLNINMYDNNNNVIKKFSDFSPNMDFSRNFFNEKGECIKSVYSTGTVTTYKYFDDGNIKEVRNISDTEIQTTTYFQEDYIIDYERITRDIEGNTLNRERVQEGKK